MVCAFVEKTLIATRTTIKRCMMCNLRDKQGSSTILRNHTLCWVFLTQLLRNRPSRIIEDPILWVIRRVCAGLISAFWKLPLRNPFCDLSCQNRREKSRASQASKLIGLRYWPERQGEEQRFIDWSDILFIAPTIIR